MKVLTIVGARPQFIKAAVLSSALCQAGIQEVLIHTGQHFEASMSEVFFQELNLPLPTHNLGIAGLTHGAMTGRMMEAIEAVLMEERPDFTILFGDTNSTLAGALASAKLGIPIAHIEAGMRSFNRSMPEEINRVVTDHLAELHFAVGDQARVWLAQEGVVKGVHVTGDVMLDAALTYREAGRRTQARRRLGPDGPPYAVVTCHRAENTDRPERLAGIIEGLERVATQIKTLIVAHPRTRQALQRTGLSFSHPGISVIDPVGYLDMLDIESGASVIITDSGGVQKEAYFCGVPCVTLRDETEWLETLEGGWNQLAGADPVAIAGLTSEALKRIPLGHPPSVVFGDGKASQKIAGIILNPPC